MLIRSLMHYGFQLSLVERENSCVINTYTKFYMKHKVTIRAAFYSKLLPIHTAHIARMFFKFFLQFSYYFHISFVPA